MSKEFDKNPDAANPVASVKTRMAAATAPPPKDGAPPDPDVHVYKGVDGNNVICTTDARGYPTYRNRSKGRIRVDATDGFIPLWDLKPASGSDSSVWDRRLTLRWRFNEYSMNRTGAPDRDAVRDLFAEAMEKWGDYTPVLFQEQQNRVDFELVMMVSDDCDAFGCVLAETFFPDAGQHKFRMWPRLFTQSHKERLDTFIHELGHVFGLRHFFANVDEADSPSKLFGTDNRLSIMNYGEYSELTETDRNDLKSLYERVWSGELTRIDSAPIRLFKPWSSFIDDDVRPVSFRKTRLTESGRAAAAMGQSVISTTGRIVVDPF